MAKRYEIVTHGGVLSTQPPLAVVYLEGSFSKPVTPSTKQIAQKNLAFVPPLLPIQAGTRIEFPNLDDTYHPATFFHHARTRALRTARGERDSLTPTTFHARSPFLPVGGTGAFACLGEFCESDRQAARL